MSYTNLGTGKIVGAKKNSFKWWHERGHQVFNNLDAGIKVSYKQDFYLKMSITSVIFGQVSKSFYYAAFVFIILHWIYFLYEEYWCWNYAFKNVRRNK